MYVKQSEGYTYRLRLELSVDGSSFAILWMGMTVSRGGLQLPLQFSHVYNAFQIWRH